MELVAIVYDLTEGFSREEMFGLSSQPRRAAVSIPSNDAEGQGRNSTKEFINHLSIAYGSLMEAETQILIDKMRSYIASQQVKTVLDKAAEIGRLINGLANSLGRKARSDH